MRRLRYLLWLALGGILVGGYFVLGSFGILGTALEAKAKAVPPGDQEVAYIQAATNGASWERFITGMKRIQKLWPELEIDASRAFPEQSAAVPEVVLSYPGASGKLWVRWYKLTSEASSERWVQELAQREPPPLALIGGGSSDRARDLAQALQERRGQWRGEPPLLLITTATADNVGDSVPQQPLMSLYPGLSYRFCFTNSQMAEAIWDFVWTRDDLRPYTQPNTVLPGAIGQLAGGDLWGGLPWLLWGSAQPQPYMVHIVRWLDDPYSRDLAHQFWTLFDNPDYPSMPVNLLSVPYSVGGFLTPNPREALAVQQMIRYMPLSHEERFLLILPAVDKPARRFLRALASAAPREVGNVVVVTGDSISFNTLYRDRQISWNILDLPAPVVAFCHQNPVAWARADGAPPQQTTGTDDELLNADIMQLLVEAAFSLPASPASPPALVANAAQLNEAIKRRRALYFGPDGNRLGGSGEFLMVLRPLVVGGRVLPHATLEVWERKRAADHTYWDRATKLDIDYHEGRREAPHGAF
ncbi:MAG: hypothetical protein JNM56_02870 [Planctomycetia bacterium]|nr:hypothetical protein [Planctomycetia bacterium]